MLSSNQDNTRKDQNSTKTAANRRRQNTTRTQPPEIHQNTTPKIQEKPTTAITTTNRTTTTNTKPPNDQNAKTPKRPNSKTARHQDIKTPTQQNTKTPPAEQPRRVSKHTAPKQQRNAANRPPAPTHYQNSSKTPPEQQNSKTSATKSYDFVWDVRKIAWFVHNPMLRTKTYISHETFSTLHVDSSKKEVSWETSSKFVRHVLHLNCKLTTFETYISHEMASSFAHWQHETGIFVWDSLNFSKLTSHLTIYLTSCLLLDGAWLVTCHTPSGTEFDLYIVWHPLVASWHIPWSILKSPSVFWCDVRSWVLHEWSLSFL